MGSKDAYTSEWETLLRRFQHEARQRRLLHASTDKRAREAACRDMLDLLAYVTHYGDQLGWQMSMFDV